MSNKDYYEILQVHSKADPEMIKKAFKLLVSKHHPDHGGDAAKFIEIKEAYDVLSNPSKRAAYDATYSKVSSSSTPSDLSSTSTDTPPPPRPTMSSNPFLACWHQFTYYSGQILSFGWQAIVGFFIFFILLGIVAPIIDFVLWIFGNRHWLTETFIGLFIFSGMLAISLFFASEAAGGPKYRKVSYAVGGVLLLMFLMGEGIPAAYSHRFGNGDVLTQEVEPITTTAIMGSNTTAEGASYVQNKQNLTYSEVKALQTALAEDKSIYPEGYITGTYGKLTHSALIRFQKKYGLSAKGYYGPRTQAKIKEIFGVTVVAAQATTKNTASTPTPVTQVTQEYLTLRFVNQYGVPYETYPNSESWRPSIYLADTLDEKVAGRFRWDQTEKYMKFDQKISEKQYNIVWEAGATKYEINPNSNYRSDVVRRGHKGGSQLITYKKNTILPVIITVPQLGTEYSQLYITMSIVNEVGTPVSYAKGGVYDSDNKKVGSISSGSKETPHSYSWKYGTLPGIYTLKITASTYKQKTLSVTVPDLSKLTNVQIIALPKIDLGKIVLEKE